eukprot:SAG11_NODE_430_length_9532_cov_13.089685_6_plen_71_part_00
MAPVGLASKPRYTSPKGGEEVGKGWGVGSVHQMRSYLRMHSVFKLGVALQKFKSAPATRRISCSDGCLCG